MTKKVFKTGIVLAAVVLLGFTGFYTYWEVAPPGKTCVSCHEITGSHDVWEQSAHRRIDCSGCHGTALSSGFHSLKEKANMVFTHFGDDRPEDIRLSEQQIVETMDRCESCHAREYAGWISGGHSATYGSILLDEVHNREELLSGSCLRCHGMFFEGNIADVVQPLDIAGPWKLVDSGMEQTPTIPCMACHQVHSPGNPAVRPDYSDPARISEKREDRVAPVSFYDRYEKIHFSVAELPVLTPVNGKTPVRVSTDEDQRLCAQCHAPNGFHQAGSSDDRTPRGVHEGLSCAACHDAHSNDASASCTNCHPALSNCGLNVAVMNTSFADPASANNVHFVACADCHEQGFLTTHGR